MHDQLTTWMTQQRAQSGIGRQWSNGKAAAIDFNPKDPKAVGQLLEFALLELQILEAAILAIAKELDSRDT
jgi:hypothetical protein